MFLFFQETCGKTLEEMDDIFNNESIFAFKVKSKGSKLDADMRSVKKASEYDGTAVCTG